MSAEDGKLLAQGLDVLVHRARGHAGLRAPHFSQQHAPGDHAQGVAQEVREQLDIKVSC